MLLWRLNTTLDLEPVKVIGLRSVSCGKWAGIGQDQPLEGHWDPTSFPVTQSTVLVSSPNGQAFGLVYTASKHK